MVHRCQVETFAAAYCYCLISKLLYIGFRTMFRTSSTQAVVLHRHRVGEIHKGLLLLTLDMGMIRALAHGAYKMRSRFRTVTEPFSNIKVYLYHDPVKDQYKITDAVSLSLFTGIQGNIVKFFIASLWAEVIIKSFGGGESSGELFNLFRNALKYLDSAAAGSEHFVSQQFLWRFMALSGFSPELSVCSNCSVEIENMLYFPDGELAPFCNKCIRGKYESLSAGARRYLQTTLQLPLSAALKVGLMEESVISLKQVTFQLVQTMVDSPLNTIKTGKGIL